MNKETRKTLADFTVQIEAIKDQLADVQGQIESIKDQVDAVSEEERE